MPAVKPLSDPRIFKLLITIAISFSCCSAIPIFANEADLKMPALDSVRFHGIDGRSLLIAGLGVCVAGLIFGLIIYGQLKNLPVHKSMKKISELIYETCKTYLRTQVRFILFLEIFIAIIIAFYFKCFAGKSVHVTTMQVSHRIRTEKNGK